MNSSKMECQQREKRPSKSDVITGNDFIALDNNASTVVSVVENRAREVCICKISTSNRYTLEITIVSDSHSYNETILLLQEISPNEILLHDGCRSKALSKKIEKAVQGFSKVLYINRQNFDQDRGGEMLEKVKLGNVDSNIVARYIVLSGSYCLLRYLEQLTGTAFPPRSLRIILDNGFKVSEKMSIDRRSAVNLELVADNMSGDQHNTLFGVINFCKTTVGARLLRSNVLRPLIDLGSIRGRNSVVEALLKKNGIFSDIVSQLIQFPDLDKMINSILYHPKTLTPATMRLSTDALIYIKHTIAVATRLGEILQRLHLEFDADEANGFYAKSLVTSLINQFQNSSLQKIKFDIDNLLYEKSQYSKAPQEMRYQECFAIQNGVNGKLDVLRKTYLEGIEEMNQLAAAYTEKEGIPVKLHFTSVRGYFLSIPSDLHSLPGHFVQAVLNKSTIYCSTLELISVSDRITEAIVEALQISNDIIISHMDRIREDIDALFNLTDGVALIDMLVSFADLVALSNETYTKPTVVEHGPMVIRSGRHPVITKLRLQRLEGPFVANDTLLSDIENFQIVTGANGSGKTVYVKQVAQVVILAQIGCFVPATYALIPIRDKILTRIGNNDDIEHNLSTFSVEMKESAYLVDCCSNKSLVLIDELGRGSSNIDGLTLALAVAEDLLRSKALVLFTTHFAQLCVLEKLYPNIKTVNIKSNISLEGNMKRRIQLTHQLSLGPCESLGGYGIVLAEICGFPKEVIEAARSVRSQIGDKLSISVNSDSSSNKSIAYMDRRKKAILEQASLILDAAQGHHNMINRILAQLSALITPEDLCK